MSLCESSDLTCTLTNLTCGQSYSVQVVAQDDTCSSLPSQAARFHSGNTTDRPVVSFVRHNIWTFCCKCFCFPILLLVPCTPNISSVALDCFTNSALLDWTYSEGALNYTATAQSQNGHVSTCSSNFTNCELPDLQCGRTYDVVAVASNEKCSSPPSSSLQVESGETRENDLDLLLLSIFGVVVRNSKQ